MFGDLQKNFRKYFLSGLALALVGLGVLPACHDRRAGEAKLATGKAYFEGYGCAQCHRVGEKGGTLGPDLTFVGFRKTPEWLDLWLQNPPAWKKNTIMPNFYLRPEVRKEMVNYLSSLKGEAYVDNAPWRAPHLVDDPVKRGEAIFVSVGCTGCHGVNGKGGYPNNNVTGGKIPTLTLVADGYTKEELTKKIKLGVHPQKADPNGPDPMILMPPWGQVLKDEEIDAVADYLISLRPATTGGDSWE